MACQCIGLTDQELKPMGAMVDSAIELKEGRYGGLRAVVTTFWQTGKPPKRGQRLPIIVATFCPFCGVRYDPETA